MGLGARFLYRIVKNEAMKAGPPEIYGWRVFMLACFACFACFGGILFGIDIRTTGGVLMLPASIADDQPFLAYSIISPAS